MKDRNKEFTVSADDWRSFKNRLYTLIAPVAHKHLIIELVKDLQSGNINKTAQQPG